MSVNWTDKEAVLLRLGDAKNAQGWENSDLVSSLERAQDFLQPYFVAAVGTATLVGWKSVETTPRAVRTLVADLAAAYILSDFSGQSLTDKQSKGGGLYASVMDIIDAIVDGSYQLIESDGDPVAGSSDLPFSTTKGKNAVFTMGNTGDDSSGTLDGY